MRGAGCAVLLLLAAGCGDDVVRPPSVVQQGALEVRVWDAPARIAVLRGGELIWESLPGDDGGAPPPDVIAAARTTRPILDGFPGGVQMSFGSFRFGVDEPTAWTGVATFQQVTVGPDRVDFVMHDAGGVPVGRGQVLVSASGGGGEVVVGIEPGGAPNRTSFGFVCQPGEHFLGLGGQSWSIDHRGQTVPLWVQEDGIGKLDAPDDVYEGIWALIGRRHSTHTPMPIMLSSRGYALAVDTSARAIFDLCDTDPDAARLESWEATMRVHLFVGDTPRDAIARMTAWTGRPEIPPAFTFAPWLDALYGSANVRRVANALRAADVPVSAIWTEDWRGGNDEGGAAGGYVLEEDWRVDRDLYPDFEQLAADLHRGGFKFLTYTNTFLDVEADVFGTATTNGYTIKDPLTGQPYLFTGVKFRDSTMLDLSNPEAVAWAKGVYGEALALGSDGWMADFAEWLPTDAALASGEDGLLAHNRYAVEWARLNAELLRERQAIDGVERIFFARAAHLGSQPHIQVLWAGDQQTDFSLGDGLPSVIPMGIGLGLTGFPYYGHDIAGYMSQTTEPVSRELWFRWVTFGALSPVMRTHHGRSARENWNWESDEASTEHLARWARLHMQLVPYQRAMAAEARATGAPLFRPFALDWPAWEPGWTLADQYLLGDRIAVAPVVTAGASERDVRLPPGTWFGLLDARAFTSDGTTPLRIAAPLDDIPAVVADCTLLALYPPEVDTVVDAVGATVTAAEIGDDREVWVYPCRGAPGAVSALAEVGGLTYSRGAGVFSSDGATWNGAPITFTVVGRWASADVIGPGVFAVGGVEQVRVDGGSPARRIKLRFAL